MYDIFKIFHELIVDYRLPKQMEEEIRDQKNKYLRQRQAFEKTLSQEQKRQFAKLGRLGVKAIYFELKKYYYLGYDNAKDK